MLTRDRVAAGAVVPSAGVSPLVAERLSDRLAERLGREIGGGQLRPGDRLPTEQRLAAAHGVSRTVVREAVHQLKSRGLLRSRQGSGVYVTAAPAGEALTLDLSVIGSIDDVMRIREVRRALEAETAALAAERATRAQVASLRRALRAIDQSAAQGRDAVDEDLAFHRLLAEAAGNPHFVRLLEFLEQYALEAMRVTRRNDLTRPDFVEAVRKEHRAIVDAVALGDPALARRRALQHMRGGDRRMRTAAPISSTAKAARR
ncbi:MAG TPA: FCD domain-containing protein [Caldimonas sp.]|nr:FCD domain-containing protein [Caldimonas sp.]